MKKSGKVALGGILAALSLVIMLAAWVPVFTYALPALAGCLLIIFSIEINSKWAFAVYAAVGILSFFICEKEAAILYIFFFGYYPVVKSFFERVRSRPVEWILKVLLFNIAVIAAYTLAVFAFGIQIDMMGDFGKYAPLILLLLGNIVFIIYDIALTRLITGYMSSLHKTLKKYVGK